MTLSPSAYIDTDDDPALLGPYAIVNEAVCMNVTVSPLRLVVTGPSNAEVRQLAIGQRLSAVVQVGGLPTHAGDRYVWSKPSGGAPFADYDPTKSSNQFTAFAVPSNTTNGLSCYFAKPGGTSVQCTFHSGYLNQDISLAESLNVQAATRPQHAEGCGTMQLRPNTTNPVEFSLCGKFFTHPNFDGSGGTETTEMGMYALDQVLDPPTSTGGKFCYLQYVVRSDNRSGQAVNDQGLDDRFPYDRVFNANGSDQGYTNDIPGVQFTFPLAIGYSFTNDTTYTTYLMYKPTDSAAGSSVYVPLYKMVWTAKGFCYYSGTSWTGYDSLSKIITPATDFDADNPNDKFPEWNIVIH